MRSQMRIEMMVDEKVLPKGGLGKITEELEPVFLRRK